MSDQFEVKDSGERQQFTSGMVRDTAEGKADYTRLLDGPMFDRWADHLAKGAVKYKDVAPGVANWTLASGPEELTRFVKSAFRHFRQWLRGDRDEDHAAAVFFNINGAEFVRARMNGVITATEVKQRILEFTKKPEPADIVTLPFKARVESSADAYDTNLPVISRDIVADIEDTKGNR